MTTTLSDLISRVEKLTGPDREVDWLIAEAIGHDSFSVTSTQFPPFAAGSKADKAIPHYTRSLDAAMTLVPEGYDYGIAYSKQYGLEAWVQKPFKSSTCHQGYAPEGMNGDATRALSLTAAALRAREAMEDR